MARSFAPALAAIASLGFFGVANAQAGLSQAAVESDRRPTLQNDQPHFTDRMAADFFEQELRLSQSRRLEANTAEIYRTLSHEERETFREKRRLEWRSFSEEQRQALRGVKRPAYANLAEAQKEPFRQTARKRLGATAPTPAALIGADGQDI